MDIAFFFSQKDFFFWVSMNAFCSISFSHTYKLGNFVTYNLVKYVRHVSGFPVWMEDISPRFVGVFLANFG